MFFWNNLQACPLSLDLAFYTNESLILETRILRTRSHFISLHFTVGDGDLSPRTTLSRTGGQHFHTDGTLTHCLSVSLSCVPSCRLFTHAQQPITQPSSSPQLVFTALHLFPGLPARDARRPLSISLQGAIIAP